ncbi:hypothetical protein THERMOT_665, partial [Bathymodiolus thermophilus thioautotrophic gill symbiont]|uniref:C80 family cysteine peptidase n=1 Tax=Bathymodiolus thermophilus thioautotrophic gill symbiont TaxID=2360 RepID=UPI001A2BC29A
HGDIQINPDGTKTMVVGGEKMIYQWNADLDIVTQQTEESKRVAEVLSGLKLGGASSKGASGIPNTLTSKQVNTEHILGEGMYKTAYNFENKPELLVLLLKSNCNLSNIKEEEKWLKQLDALGIKTPKRYKQIKFVDKSNKPKTVRHGLVMQKIKGAQDVRLAYKYLATPPKVLDNSNNKTLEDIKHLQKIFTKKPNFSVSDFQAVIAEDGQLYIIDPMGVDTHPSGVNHASQLDALQTFEQHILWRHKRFTSKTLNHIIYVDKQLWESPDDALKQQMLSDAQKDKNKVIVAYDVATGQKEVVHQPSGNQNLTFDTVEVIARDTQIQNVNLKKDCLDFAKKQGWGQSKYSVFRVNTPEEYETLNLKSNGKNKHDIILSIGKDKVTNDATESLHRKHPENSMVVTLNERGKLVFPGGKKFIPDSSVRINIVGLPEELEKVGAERLANYTDEIVKFYKIDSVGSHAYLNRATLVGCNNKKLSKNYAEQLYTREYLRGASVTDRSIDMQINADNPEATSDHEQKIIHNWDYDSNTTVWETESSEDVDEILKNLKIGLNDTPPVDMPDLLDYNDIGKRLGKSPMKTTFALVNYPHLLFLQLNIDTLAKVKKLESEVAWMNKMQELGIKTPKYHKVVAVMDQDNQNHYGILAEHIRDSEVIKLDSPDLMKNEYITKRTLNDIQNLSDKFEQNPELYIPDLQMLMAKDGQLYVFNPESDNPPMARPDSRVRQGMREANVRGLKMLSEKATLFLRGFNENNRMHAIFVDDTLLKKDPKLKEKLINKAKKQQDLAVFSYNIEGKFVKPIMLYQPDNPQLIDRIEVMSDRVDHFPSQKNMFRLVEGMPSISNDMIFRCRPAENFSNYRTNIIVQHGNSDTAIKAAQDLANKHPDNSIIVHFDADNKLVTADNELYTPNGNVRLSFVDHGENFVTDESSMDELVDKVKQINDTYGNENTYFERIALVGCDTNSVRKGLTKDFARAVYNNIPTLRNADITGRTGEVQVNDDGTKTMKTGGAKTVYSWRNGDIVSKTEDAKTTADTLKNPLGLTIIDFISERIYELELSTAPTRTPAESEFHRILSGCRDYVNAFDYKDMSAQEKISFFQGVKEKLSNFADTGTPPPSMQTHIATFDNFVVEAISRSEHRIRMNDKFPVTITKGNKIPNIIHYVWTGGAMPEPYLENIKAIGRQNDKLVVRLHYDPNALLMNELKIRMKAYVDNNLPITGNRMYEAVKLTKKFSNYCGDRDLSSDIVKGFMIDELGVPRAEVNEVEEKINKYWSDFPESNPKLELAPILFDDAELSGMKKAYQFELKNGSMAGASDAVRFSVLHTEGGIYTDVGLIFNRIDQDNILHNYIKKFPEHGFPRKQAIGTFHSAYPFMANNNFLVAAPHSKFTGTLVQDVSEAYNGIISNRVERVRRSYGGNQVLDQYSTSIVPLGEFYLEHINHLSKQPLKEHIIDTRGSWQSSWNTEGIEFIVLIVDTENLSDVQRRGLVDSIEGNIDGYNNDTYKIVVLDSHAVINPVRREIVEHMNPFFTVQKVPTKSDNVSINYPALFERSRRIIVHDDNNNFEPMLTKFSDVVERKESSEFNKTIEGVVSDRCFQVFLFDDKENFKQTIRDLAPDISRENYVALVYDEANQRYNALDNHVFKFKDGDRLKVNFIGELNNLDDAAEVQSRIFSAENALPQIEIRKHVKETRVVLSKDIGFNRSLFKIKGTFLNDLKLYAHKGTVTIHAQNDEDKSNVTILMNNKTGHLVAQDNETLLWKALAEFDRNALKVKESRVGKSDKNSLNKYHNIVIQSGDPWRVASYHLAGDTNFKGDTSIVQVSDSGFRTIYGTPSSLITGDVRIIFAFDDSDYIIGNMKGISKALNSNVKIKDIHFINSMDSSALQKPDAQASYMEQVLRIAHRYKDAKIYMQQDLQSNKHILRNYSFELPYMPSNSSSRYEKKIIFKVSNDSDIDKYADKLTISYPNISYIATLDPITGGVRLYDSYGNVVTDANIHGEYEIHVLGRVADLRRMNSAGLSDHIINLQKSINVEPQKVINIKLTACSTKESAASDLLFDTGSYALNTAHQLIRYNPKLSLTKKNTNIIIGTDKNGITTTTTNTAHLSETTPHQDTPLHNWADLSQEQINKLTTEAQKPQPSLANHDHQVLIQTEADGNVRDSTFRLASKHPAQTTIVQMQKDGTHQVVYGLDLEDITG